MEDDATGGCLQAIVVVAGIAAGLYGLAALIVVWPLLITMPLVATRRVTIKCFRAAIFMSLVGFGCTFLALEYGSKLVNLFEVCKNFSYVDDLRPTSPRCGWSPEVVLNAMMLWVNRFGLDLLVAPAARDAVQRFAVIFVVPGTFIGGLGLRQALDSSGRKSIFAFPAMLMVALVANGLAIGLPGHRPVDA